MWVIDNEIHNKYLEAKQNEKEKVVGVGSNHSLLIM